MIRVHSKRTINALRVLIALVDVETQAFDVRVSTSLILDKAVSPGEIPLPPMLRLEINAVDPPDDSVSPIAPFVSDQKRTNDLARDFADVVAPTRCVREN